MSNPEIERTFSLNSYLIIKLRNKLLDEKMGNLLYGFK